jgi:GTP-binding protein
MSVNFNNCKFHGSYVNYLEMPKSISEIAFIGRSNVGKSSLINKICNNKNICQTSKRPGKTSTINVITFDHCFRNLLIDLPGYGFALASSDLQKIWQSEMPNYLANREQLKCVFLLIDFTIGFTDLDMEVVGLLDQWGVDFVILFTKTDKAKSKFQEMKNKADEQIRFLGIKKFYFISSKNNTNIGLLRSAVVNLLN